MSVWGPVRRWLRSRVTPGVAAVGGLGTPSCCAEPNVSEGLLLSEKKKFLQFLFFSGRKERQAEINGVRVRDNAANGKRSCGERRPRLVKSGEIWKVPPRLPARRAFSQPSALFCPRFKQNGRRLKGKGADFTPLRNLSLPSLRRLGVRIGGNLRNGKC